ncbi:molybdopterin-dependent oxidoreductase [Hyperthermus butylicus]|uniref:Anaerobic dehydrogenases, typically selenocysteine-containing n=1 Tax=Hyperthermus butylicus (strain DSM 5456 / JCM 9403 / PLM1-5) TaxID=415426 RepID=A2BLN3_HYPBU|nr:molybdopterin-dependent oxidoreductase [Hyperthermus butylicus]ABM80894.1 Anaerobic dehydrogenases, typically selenocysteine-containing [Hyperthermus butylicus DSM 5456]
MQRTDNNSLKLSRRALLRAAIVGGVMAVLPKASLRALGFAAPKRYRLGEIGSLDLEETVEVRGVCTYCSVGCGIIFYRRGNRVVYLEGDPDNPLNEGKLCAKGKAGIQLFGAQNPLRARKPLIRVSPKPKPEEILAARDSNELMKVLEKYKPVWREVTWEEAFAYIMKKMREILEENRDAIRAYHPYDGKVCDSKKGCWFRLGNQYPVMIIAGAKLLNEEAYLIRKISMLIGSNNIDHDARRCHSTTVAGLAGTVGFGAQTQSFPDTQYISVYLILGGNPAEAHPVSMRHVMKGVNRGTLKLVVVDPRYGRTASKAELFAFHRPGTDIAVLYYLLHYAFWERNPPIDQLPEFKEYAKRFNIDLEEIEEIKDIAKRFTAEEVSRITGIPVDKLREIAKLFVENSGVTTGFKRFASIEWAMGLTQHHVGTQNTRLATLVQLALGNVGFPGGGLNPYRGHSNVQGTTDLCILSHIFPGYIKIPTNSKQIRAYQEWKLKGFPDAFNWRPSMNTCKALGLKCEECDENGDNCKLRVDSNALLWSWWFMNWRRYELAMGIFVGTDPEDKPWDENSAVISDLPLNKGYTENTWWMGVLMPDDPRTKKIGGKIDAMWIFAENIAVSNADAKMTMAALSALKLLVVADIFLSETAWFADVFLPSAFQYEKEGSITNSNRWIQWQHRVVEPPGDAKPDLWIMYKFWEYMRRSGLVRLPSEEYGKRVERVLVKHPDADTVVELYRRKIEPFMNYGSSRYPWRDYQEVDPVLVYKEIDAAVDLYYGQYDWAHDKILAMRRISAPRVPGQPDGLIDSGELEHPGGKAPLRLYKDWGWSWPRNVRILYNLYTLDKTFGIKDKFTFESGKYAVGPELDGKTVEIWGETGEIIDAKTKEPRPAFIPGHNFFIGKYYKRAWTCLTEKCREKSTADIFTGAVSAEELIREGKTAGKIVVWRLDGSYEVKTVDELGIRCPMCESFYYDEELVIGYGKAAFNKPYFKGSKTVNGKVVVYKDWKEWRQVHDKFIEEFKSCMAGNPENYRKCVKQMIDKYGEWYATMGPDGNVWAYSINYPYHFEPVESPSLELATTYPAIAWRRIENMFYIEPPEKMPELYKAVTATMEELQRIAPEGAAIVVVTENRLEEHWHTGMMSRNVPYLAELIPEPFIEIPKELADKLGIKSGDVVEVGNNRNVIYLRALVTHRMPKLNIAGKEVYVVNIPWHWGWSGAHNSFDVANTISILALDIVTTMQETKAFLAWLRKAPPEKYTYKSEPRIKTAIA